MVKNIEYNFDILINNFLFKTFSLIYIIHIYLLSENNI